MAFEKIFLANGEPRAEYVERRLKEGAATAAILAEINAPELYSGSAGGIWGVHVVNAAKHKLQPKAQTAKADLIGEAHPKRPAYLDEPKRMQNETKPSDLIGEAHPKSAPDKGGEAPGWDIEVDSDETVAPKRPVPAEAEGILDAEDVAEVYAEAEKALRAEQRKTARADLLKKAKAELQREAKEAELRAGPKGDMVNVYIDLAPFAEYISLDGRRFYHGKTELVKRDQANVIMEQCQRSWQHQEGISGKRQEWTPRKGMSRVTSAGAFVDGRMVRA